MTELMALGAFAAVQYAFLIVLAAAAYLLGASLVRREWFDSRWEEVGFAGTLGLGVISHGMLLLGSLGLFYRSAVLLLFGGLLVLGWRRWAPQALGLLAALRQVKAWQWGLALVGLGLALPMLALPLYPPMGWDATEYYLASAKLYVEAHQLLPTPYLRFIVYPQLSQMLFTLGLLFTGEVSAHLTLVLSMLLTAAALMGTGRRMFSRAAGVWAAAFLVGHPLVLWLSANAYLDMGVLQYLTVATFAFLRWQERRERHWLMILAALLGFSASAKYTTLLFVALAGLFVAVNCLRTRQFRQLVGFGLLFLAVGAPWYVRNAWYTGNPVFPMMSGVFGYSHFDEFDTKQMLSDLGRTKTSDVMEILTIPWRAAVRFEDFRSEAPLSRYFAFTLPLILFGAVRDRRIRWLAGLSVLHLVFWFFSTQLLRHLTPALPVLGLAAGGSIELLLSRRWITERRSLQAGLAAALALLFVYPSWSYARKRLRKGPSIPTNPQQREEYLLPNYTDFAAYQLLNQRKGSHYTLYAMFDEQMPYFTQGQHRGDWFGPGRYRDVVAKMQAGGEPLYQHLRSLGVDHFLYHRRNDFPTELPHDEFFYSHFKPLYTRNSIALFELQEHPIPQPPQDNLLRNPGFEELSGGQPVGWTSVGSPEVLHEPGRGAIAKGLGLSDHFMQSVPVEPGQYYRLSFLARGLGKEPTAVLQVRWGDGTPEPFFDADTAFLNLDDTWRRYEFFVFAPSQATRADIPAVAGEPKEEILFDDFRFVRAAGEESPAPLNASEAGP